MLIFLIFHLLTFQPSETMVTGTLVGYELGVVPGASVTSITQIAPTITDVDGNFSIRLFSTEPNQILFKYPEGYASTVINNIPNLDSVNLGNIPFIPLKGIEPEEYQRLNKKQQSNYKPVQHWASIIGYYHVNMVDQSALQTVATKLSLSLEQIHYDSKSQTIFINYNNLRSP